MKQSKTFSNAAMLDIVLWYNNIRSNPDNNDINSLPIKIQWLLKKNIDIILPKAKAFEDFRNQLNEKLKGEFFNNEKSEEFTEKTTDAETGKEIEIPSKRIKKEFINEFEGRVSDMNQELSEIAHETYTVKIDVTDIDDIVNNLDDNNSALNISDLEILHAFMGKEDAELTEL